MPRPCCVLRQVGLREGLGQIAAHANFLVVWPEASERLAVLQKHERDVLIVSPINAIGEIARGLCNTWARFLHKSDYQTIRFLRLSQEYVSRASRYALRGDVAATISLLAQENGHTPSRTRTATQHAGICI